MPKNNNAQKPVYYIYHHLKKTNGEIFYIGKGKRRRAWEFNERNKKWKEIAENFGVDVIIVKDGLTELEAYSLEKEHIFNIGIENLTNISTGGIGGSSGVTCPEHLRKLVSQIHLGKPKPKSKEHREKISAALKGSKQSEETKKAKSIALKGKKSPTTGMKFSDETKLKMSQAHLGRKCWWEGKKMSEETKEKMREARKGRVFSAETKLKMSISKQKRDKEKAAKALLAGEKVFITYNDL